MLSTTDRNFQNLYRAVITASLYGGTWFACFYWPAFLGHIIFPQLITQIELIAGILVLPLGLLALGATEGLKRAGLNFLIATVALTLAIGYALATGKDGDVEFTRSLILSAMLVAYGVAGFFSFRRSKGR